MRRTKEEAAVTRENLLKAGLAVFSIRGYAATTLDDVAKEAGVTRGAIYWHFGSKVELYNALLDKYSARGHEIVQQAASEGGSLVDILHRILVRLLSAVENDDQLHAVMEISLFKTEWALELATSRDRQVQSGRSLLAGITEVMQQGVENGQLRADLDPADLARAFLSFQNGAVYFWLLDPGSFSLQKSAESMADAFIHGIARQNQG